MTDTGKSQKKAPRYEARSAPRYGLQSMHFTSPRPTTGIALAHLHCRPASTVYVENRLSQQRHEGRRIVERLLR